MLSRVAESIYWMARNLERAENVARFMDVNLHLVLESSADERDQWEPLVTVTGDHDIFFKKYKEANQENVTRFLTFDRDYPHSIASCVAAARENARSIREIISTEIWEQVNNFYLSLKDPGATGKALATPHDFFTKVKTQHQLFIGLCEGTMSYGEGWHFMHLGRLLERADKTSRILDVKYFVLLPQPSYVGTSYDRNQWAAVLKSASGLEMYRKRFHQITPADVADFLIFDKDFPRSLRHCIVRTEESLHEITGTPFGEYRTVSEQRLGRLRSEMDFSGIQDVFQRGLHEFIDDFQATLNRVGEAVFEDFFARRPATQSSFLNGGTQ